MSLLTPCKETNIFCSTDCYLVNTFQRSIQTIDSVHASHLTQCFGMMIHVVIYEGGDCEVRVIIAILHKQHTFQSKVAYKQKTISSQRQSLKSAGGQSAGEHKSLYLQPIIDTELAFCCLLECLWF